MTKVDKRNILFYKNELYNNKINKNDLLSRVKNNLPLESISMFLRENDSHPFVKKYFYSEPLPKKINKLGSNSYTYKTNFEKEFGITILGIIKFQEEINQFLILKRKFNKFLLLGNYEDACAVLNEVEENIGYSIWFLENKFIVEENLRGLEGNKELLNLVNSDNTSPIVNIICHFLSIRAENKISHSNYIYQYESYFSEFENEIKSYFNFKLNYLKNIGTFTELLGILFYDSNFSIIDRYETLIKISQLVLVDPKFDNEKEIISNLLVKLQFKITDPILNNLLVALDPKSIILDDKINGNELNIYENYTTGNYRDSSLGSLKLMKDFASDISFCEIHVKSMLYLGTSKKENSIPKSLIDNIIFDLNNIYLQNEDYFKSLTNLQRTTSFNENAEWARQLFAFIEYDFKKSDQIHYERFRQLNSCQLNPLFYKVFFTKTESSNYLRVLMEKNDLNVLKLFYTIENAKTLDDLNDLTKYNIPEYRKLLYSAKTLEKLGEKEKASLIYEQLILLFPTYLIVYHEAVHNLLDCYYKLGNYNSYVTLFVLDSFKSTKLKIFPEEIHKKMEGIRFLGINKSIFLPIFYFLTNNNYHLINLTIRQLLKSYNCKQPTEIIQHKDNFDSKHLIFFLRYLCTQEILKFFTFFKGTKEILNERLGICRILLTLDKENDNIYNEEIGVIAKSIVIMEGMRQVDESKIFVDEKGLKLNELKEVRNNFERYISISEVLEKVPIVFLNIKQLKEVLSNIQLPNSKKDDVEKLSRIVDIRYNYFKEIFLEIRDKFLFNNKFGLDAYLSTRIRHGTLLGQIRSKFQDFHLITQREKDEIIYLENEYWSNKFTSTAIQKEELQSILSKFSSKVDSLTNELKNELIQIRTEEKINAGLFDYRYPDRLLADLFVLEFNSIKEYEVFLDQIFKKLWERTKDNLTLIRDHIATNIKERCIEYLEELEDDLKTLGIDFKIIQELTNNIVSCKTNIIWEIDTISNWFQIKETNVKDFLIDKAIDTSLEITNRISEDVKIINLKKDIKSRTLLKGSNFITYFDLLRIFFDNILKYSGNISKNLEVKIIAQEINNYLIITIINNLDQSSNIENVKQIFNQNKKDLDSPNWDMERTKKEGNTGFYKAKKILVADLQSENNSFDFKVNQDNEVEISISIQLN